MVMSSKVFRSTVPFAKEFKSRPGSILDEPYVISMLVMLLDEEEINASAFSKSLSTNYYTIKDIAQKMEEMGLIVVSPRIQAQISAHHNIDKKRKGSCYAGKASGRYRRPYPSCPFLNLT